MIGPKRPYQQYHEESRIEGRHMKSETWADVSAWPKQWSEITCKTYPRLPAIPLPQEEWDSEDGWVPVVHQRGSSRERSDQPLDLSTLARILRHSLGLRGKAAEEQQDSRRVYPSAGARFPLECYVVAQDVEGMEPGVYHYQVLGERMTRLCGGDYRDEIHSIFGFEWIAHARAVLLLTAVMERTTMKYGERGYRFVLLEAGHAMQNVCLISSALGVPITTVGGFADQKAARLLDVDGEREIVVYSAVFP